LVIKPRNDRKVPAALVGGFLGNGVGGGLEPLALVAIGGRHGAGSDGTQGASEPLTTINDNHWCPLLSFSAMLRDHWDGRGLWMVRQRPLLFFGDIRKRDLRQVLRGVGRTRVESEFAEQPNRALVIPAPVLDQSLIEQKDALCLTVGVGGQPLLDGCEFL